MNQNILNMTEHLYGLVRESQQIAPEKLAHHWVMISSLAALISDAHLLRHSKKTTPVLKMTPKETGDDLP